MVIQVDKMQGRSHYKYLMEGITLRQWCLINQCSYGIAYKMARNGCSEIEIKKKLLKKYIKSVQSIFEAAEIATARWANAKSENEKRIIRSEFTADYSYHPRFEDIWDEITLGTYVFKGEKWKTIPGYKHYQVSNEGRVRKYYSKSKICKFLIPFRKARKNKKGKTDRFHMVVKIESQEFILSRLVAEAFIPHDAEHTVVSIKDKKWKHIWADNLEWVTKRKMGSISGYSPKCSKAVVQLDEEGNIIKEFRSARSAAKELYVSYQTVLDYCHHLVRNPIYLLEFKEEVGNSK